MASRASAHERAGARQSRPLRDNGLTIALLALFLCSLGGQWVAGWHVANADAGRHGGAAMSLASYAASPQFLSSVFENWESEFLQMATYVVLTAMLFQRGSSESKDPDDTKPRDADLTGQAANPEAPAILRRGPVARAIYARSLGLTLALLFVASFLMHWMQSARVAAEDAVEHGEAAPTMVSYLFDAQPWFESMQNWQSEFLSTAVLVVLSIYLRQRESPESKAVAAPHGQTGA